MNLVPNGDFEFYTQCPDDYGQTDRAFPWYQPNLGSSDYFNSCTVFAGSSLNTDVPENSFGYQYAHSGEGYCGFGGVVPGFYYFEYIATPLEKPLEASKKYCVSFWVSLSDTICLTSDHLGVYVGQDSMLNTLDYFIDANPQFQTSDLISEQQEWVEVNGTFIANGGEKYLAIGVFDTVGISTYSFCSDTFSTSTSYYYIDDVSLYECEGNEDPDSPSTSGSNLHSIPNIVTSNNDGTNDTWMVFNQEEMTVVILNRWGNKVFEGKGTMISWLPKDEHEGTYFYVLKTKNEQKTGFIQLVR